MNHTRITQFGNLPAMSKGTGPGSRGGVIVGMSRSGKPRYASGAAGPATHGVTTSGKPISDSFVGHAGWSSQDHREASAHHAGLRNAAAAEMEQHPEAGSARAGMRDRWKRHKDLSVHHSKLARVKAQGEERVASGGAGDHGFSTTVTRQFDKPATTNGASVLRMQRIQRRARELSPQVGKGDR